jgi:hypothetical protein
MPEAFASTTRAIPKPPLRAKKAGTIIGISNSGAKTQAGRTSP